MDQNQINKILECSNLSDFDQSLNMLDINKRDLTSEQLHQITNKLQELYANNQAHNSELFKNSQLKKILSTYDFFERLLKNNFQDANINSLSMLYENYPNVFRETIKTIAPDSVLFKYVDFLNLCLKLDFHDSLNVLMSLQNVNDINDFEYYDSLVACAAIAEANPQFKTTIINSYDDFDELEDYFNYIKENMEKFDGQTITFICAGAHWFSGALKIDMQDKNQKYIHILFNDALGVKQFNKGELFPEYDQNPISGHPKYKATSIFGDNLEMHVAKQQRQKSNNGCSVFAINDARILQRLISAGELIFSPNLNLRFYNVLQSVRTINAIIAKIPSAKTKLINKKGETFSTTAMKHLETKNIDGLTKMSNKHLEHKAAMLHKKIYAYLANENVDPEKIYKDTGKFTVDHFIHSFDFNGDPTIKRPKSGF
jgi:hypothetical protein